MQDFPFSSVDAAGPVEEEEKSHDDAADESEAERSMFRTPLLQYLAHVKRAICHAAGIVLNQRMGQLQRVDFSLCKGALVPSRPGRHDAQRHRWGALRLASVLAKHGACSDPGQHSLLMQCSSLGSMGENEQFIEELAESMLTSNDVCRRAHPTSKADTPIELVWPSVQCIAQSYLGYNSGGSVPCNSDIIEEKGHIKKGFRNCLRKWNATDTGRHMFPAHMKCYFRYSRQRDLVEQEQGLATAAASAAEVSLQWFLLTSANLSQAAWGKKQRKGHVLYIKSYEMGVLFLPSWLERQRRRHGVGAEEKPFSCTPSHRVLGEYKHPPSSNSKSYSNSNSNSNSGNGSSAIKEVSAASLPLQEGTGSYAPEQTTAGGSRTPHRKRKRTTCHETLGPGACEESGAGTSQLSYVFIPKRAETGSSGRSIDTTTLGSSHESSSSSSSVLSTSDAPPPPLITDTTTLSSLSFSIPFAVPADKFSFEGTDYPWTWDKPRTVPDSNGNLWPTG